MAAENDEAARGTLIVQVICHGVKGGAMDRESEAVEILSGRSKRRVNHAGGGSRERTTRGKALTWGRVMARLRSDKSAAGADLRFLHFSFWDLSNADFRNANLEGANLSQADLTGADFRGANLRSAKLLGARLCGAFLDGATLSGALVSGADFSGVRGLTAEQKAALRREGATI